MNKFSLVESKPFESAISGAQKLHLKAAMERQIALLKKHKVTFYFVFDTFLGYIDAGKIRKKIEEVNKSFPEEAKKLRSFLDHYELVNRCCDDIFFYFYSLYQEKIFFIFVF